MKLEQGQLWQAGDTYFRIVKWARLNISYKQFGTDGPESDDSSLHHVTKKEFCRVIKGAHLAGVDADTPVPQETPEPKPAGVPASEADPATGPAPE